MHNSDLLHYEHWIDYPCPLMAQMDDVDGMTGRMSNFEDQQFYNNEITHQYFDWCIDNTKGA